MTYSIQHITNFAYSPAVRESIMEVRVQPRTDPRQRCLTFSLDLSPRANIMLYSDFLGNTIHHFDIPGSHSQIRVAAQSLVEVIAPPFPQLSAAGNWGDIDARVPGGDFWEMLLPSQFARPTGLLETLAREFDLQRRDSPLELLWELNARMYEAFAYVPNSTKVDSPIDDALRTRQGVCQDFAHILIALVRQLKIPCRYVSGYLYHGDKDKNKNRSPAGASHAWVEAFLPELGWVALDPTNNLIGGENHIRVAIGRDYADVPPTRGVYKGEAESELSVLVTVSTVDTPQALDLPPATVIRSRPLSDNSADRAFQEQQQQQQ